MIIKFTAIIIMLLLSTIVDIVVYRKMKKLKKRPLDIPPFEWAMMAGGFMLLLCGIIIFTLHNIGLYPD